MRGSAGEAEKGELKPEKQGESTTEYAKMLTKEMGELDFHRSAAELERLVRAQSLAQRIHTAWRQDIEDLGGGCV